ncbi:unnamed protein product [Ostreobium quekettii]|uniref:Uncharacterized protein n=1 Tax=Ostreobium quekettii TaxID=121088 RepID=A0A8S1J3V2_9CHLO|nr:unnamed protein product [Ostreobium quekettii]
MSVSKPPVVHKFYSDLKNFPFYIEIISLNFVHIRLDMSIDIQSTHDISLCLSVDNMLSISSMAVARARRNCSFSVSLISVNELPEEHAVVDGQWFLAVLMCKQE